MDVKLSSYFILFFCVTCGLQNASGQSKIPEVTLTTDNGSNQCTRKYTTCSLKLGDKIIPERGEKGETGFPGLVGAAGIPGKKGEQGIQGIQGEPGDKGERGEPGENGPQGPPGLPGTIGSPGLNGSQGLPGINGETGPKGLDGLQGQPGVTGKSGPKGVDGTPGIPGEKGDRGKDGQIGPVGRMGPAGPVGPPGTPGRPGSCPCVMPTTIGGIGESLDDNFGSMDSPADRICKDAPSGTKSGQYYLGPKETLPTPIHVFCNMTSLETCIHLNNSTPESNHKSIKGGAFWLNEMSIHMKALYDSISAEQLTWLRDRSNGVRQTLKYNCLDSVPYSKHNMSASVKLWAWNDVVIGPYPTNESPIFYTVPEATDKCEPGSTEWKSTIIELQSSNVYRLPIVDLWIGDIRQVENQKMSIESVELCFG